MNILNISAIAVALAMDAFAVSIAAGVTLRQVSFRQTFRLAWHFGFFQAMMPVLGWSAGLNIRDAISSFDHWIAFGLLSYVGGGMLKSAFSIKKEEAEKKDPTRGLTMVMLSVATSIDALAVGFSLSVIQVSIWTPAVVIGIVAGTFTTFGIHLGKSMGATPRLSKYAEVVGGIVLLAIGLNILREHGVFDFI